MKNLNEIRKGGSVFNKEGEKKMLDRLEILAERDALIKDYKEIESDYLRQKQENREIKKEIEELNMYVSSMENLVEKANVESELIKIERSVAWEERDVWKKKALSLIKKNLSS